jgi:nitrogen-specific signal transduction histidine kinase/CheY-like chemotaxis protein
VIETTGVPVFGENRKLMGYRGIDRDVTERERLGQQLRQAQKLEAIGQLAGGVAHDFNNILAAILMQLGLLQMTPALDPETSQALKEVELGARRAASLTRQLLMFSRRSVLEVKPLDLNEVVKDMLKMLGRLIGEHIKLLFDGYTGQLPSVAADAGMLEQVLMNLVVNGRDAMPKGGTITITTRVENLGELDQNLNPNRRPGRFVCLAVSDTGVGMNENTLERIFEPFFTTKEPGTGTGLGLATVHGIVAQHKGWAEVESQVGEGTTFRVYLPALDTAEIQSAPEAARAPLQRGREVILVVEDENNVRRALGQTLRALGYRIYEAENGQQAMALWQEHGAQVDLLLTDMVMPEGMTGLELAERLLAAKPTLRVIISSGYSFEIFQAGGINQAGIWYLPKPYEAKQLAETIRGCLDGKN